MENDVDAAIQGSALLNVTVDTASIREILTEFQRELEESERRAHEFRRSCAIGDLHDKIDRLSVRLSAASGAPSAAPGPDPDAVAALVGERLSAAQRLAADAAARARADLEARVADLLAGARGDLESDLALRAPK
jgi:hypothetical protein